MKKTILASVLTCASLLGLSSTSFAACSDIPLPGKGPGVPMDIPLPGKGPGVPMAFDIPLPGKGPGVPMAFDIPIPGKGPGVPMAHLRLR